MKKFTALTVIALSFAVALAAAACSSGSNTTPTTNTANANQGKTANATSANTASANHAPPKTEDETPATIKAAFPDAQSFTKQHKDIPKNAIADIEKNTGAKVPDTDHHSYLAFSTTGGGRRQVGAATIIKADGKEIVVIYDNREGSPVIKEVRADGVAPDFLKQFAGKGHDEKLTYGNTIKANGTDDPTAKALTSAIAVDLLTMQALYGAAHTH